jgi:tellurite resistance protein TerC
MIWFWIGFFVLVALLLVLDLAVLNRGAHAHTFRKSLTLTLFWVSLGLAFSGVVYVMYQHEWLGAHMAGVPKAKHTGLDAVVVYLSAYLLELSLSVDNLFVMALVFAKFNVPTKYQHRVLFWGILGAVVFRVAMLGGGVWLVKKFDWIFYVFGAYLVFQGLKQFKPEEDEEKESRVQKFLRRTLRIVDGEHAGKFTIQHRGRRAFTMLFLCLIVIEVTDVIFALDSVPAVLAISRETFVMVTSNIFAILGLRSMYSVLAGAMEKFQYLKYALGLLLITIGAKMIANEHVHIPHLVSLGLIAGIVTAGIVASMIASRRNEARQTAPPPPPDAPPDESPTRP